jgi:nucleotide-binding universal stress UspA family protein
MSYKSLVSVVTALPQDMPAVNAAIELARALDAHLDVVALGLDRTQVDVLSYSGMGIAMMPTLLDAAQNEASTLATALSTRLEPEDIRWSVNHAVAPIIAIGSVIAPKVRYADLMISPLPLAPDRGGEVETIAETALFDAHVPLLIVPPDSSIDLGRMSILIAWNGSDEAMAAVRAALPMLKLAPAVSIAVVADKQISAERSDPGGPLAQMLSRHGIHANIAVLASGTDSAATTLLHHAREIGANFLVMGAYGHSRMREILLGGATRDMMAVATIPVMMCR